jgi:hypothetical protein
MLFQDRVQINSASQKRSTRLVVPSTMWTTTLRRQASADKHHKNSRIAILINFLPFYMLLLFNQRLTLLSMQKAPLVSRSLKDEQILQRPP